MMEPPPPYSPTAPPEHQGVGYQNSDEQTPILVVCQPAQFGEDPVSMSCPHCGASVVTRTIYQNGRYSNILCAAICAIGCFIPFLWAGCCLIPYCLPSCQDVEHRCPSCHHYLGYWRRLGL